MADRKNVRKPAKKVAPRRATVSVGRPVSKTVTVFGIEFEQGDLLTFGKCQVKRTTDPAIYNFINVGNNHLILWRPQNGYLDYFSVREPMFRRDYDVVDFDTPVIPGEDNDAPYNEDDEDDDGDDIF